MDAVGAELILGLAQFLEIGEVRWMLAGKGAIGNS
jgi:hypothetical protein